MLLELMAYQQNFIRQSPSNPLIEDAWENESFPSEWTNGIIVKIPKKGKIRDCNNWRAISVLSVVAKIISKIILEGLKKQLYLTIHSRIVLH